MRSFALTPNKYLNEAEQRELELELQRRSKDELRNTTLILFMLKTGARPDETISVLCKDINHYDRSVYIKTQKGGIDRIVPLTQDLYERILKIMPKDPNARLFNIGTHRFRQIWNLYRPNGKRLHSLRHTFAVNIYKKSGNNLSLVQKALGHTSIQTTAIYLQIQHDLEDFRKVIV